jgi:hypothetical protein
MAADGIRRVVRLRQNLGNGDAFDLAGISDRLAELYFEAGRLDKGRTDTVLPGSAGGRDGELVLGPRRGCQAGSVRARAKIAGVGNMLTNPAIVGS